ncbi:MAG TPA: hypothetical protein PLB30_05310 [Thermoleophilia bacterium]|nr:hypothetical protein [Thermoleophilia bacterium]HQG04229.1 hypothetical protein [Thermoleophilia bacterium]HQG54576.1 hypothetical protein [Thermoleophilia bacterium]HQJ97953.1 hypothetical protein [Thermoleophilia bacterium]
MRRTILATIVAVLTMLTSAGAALARDLPNPRDPDGGPPGERAGSAGVVMAREHFVPLGIKLAGSAVVNGHVYGFTGVPHENVWVYCEAPDGSATVWGDTKTDTNGFYSFSGLPAVVGTGYIEAAEFEQGGDWWWARRPNASWSDPGPTAFDWHQGAVRTQVRRAGPAQLHGSGWNDWERVDTTLYGEDVQSRIDAGSPLLNMADEVVEGSTYVPPASYSYGATYFWANQGLEYPVDVTVTAGHVASQTLSVDQKDAQHMGINTSSSYWKSGKPGTKVTIGHWQFPAGWTLDYYGWADAPTQAYTEYKDATTTGGSFAISVTIPKSAPVGYDYNLGFDRKDGVLSLYDSFQVCTLKATKAAVRKGGAVKLSGVIPTEGHWGKTTGKSKLVTVYARTKAASAAPTAWDPAKQGWTKVGQAKANGLGAYTTGNLRPKRTTWYVVRYPGDAWYWGAYTSVLRVRVY